MDREREMTAQAVLWTERERDDGTGRLWTERER